MKKDREEPSAAEMLVSLVTGNGQYGHILPTVQRSHRFPLHLFIQIENLAKMGGVSVSLIINQLIECGLEAVKEKLPSDAVQKLTFASPEQIERPTVTDREEVKKDRRTTRSKKTVSK